MKDRYQMEKRMRYISTRGEAPSVTFAEAALAGLAPDGGLYMPESFPRFDPSFWRHKAGVRYTELASDIMWPLVGAMAMQQGAFYDIVDSAYDVRVWGTDDPFPVVSLRKNRFMQKLWHGPTYAFKDAGLQFLGKLMRRLLAERGLTINILGATSGDTGPAAMDAFASCPGAHVYIMFPEKGTSERQRRQMTTLPDANLYPLAMRTDFDGCQALMKAVNAADGGAFKKKYRIGAINSTNWARILAQMVYYVDAYLEITRGALRPVVFVVPTGNFGNVFAGMAVRKLGLPIQLVIATNANDVLVEVFETGVYRKRASVVQTSSPSMDIQVSSNLERLLFLASGCDPELTARVMREFEREGVVDLNRHGLFAPLRAMGITAGSCSEDECIATMRRVFEEDGEIIDSHTAAAFAVGDRHESPYPRVYLSTASPAKFPDAVHKAIGRLPEVPPRLRRMDDLRERMIPLDADIEQVKRFIAQTAI